MSQLAVDNTVHHDAQVTSQVFLYLNRRSYKSAEDFFIGAAVLGQFGHSIALEMAGITNFLPLHRFWIPVVLIMDAFILN